jgi:hypothetical protein
VRNRVACSRTMTLPAVTRSDLSRGERRSPAPSTKPRARARKTSVRTDTRARSRSSSAESLTADRTRSPKSWRASPGITVSRSTTQSGSPVEVSKSTLAILASLWAVRTARSRASTRSASARATGRRSRRAAVSVRVEEARPKASSALARSRATSRAGVSWNRGIVSCRGGAGRSVRWRRKRPKARAAAPACGAVSARSHERVPSIQGKSRHVSPSASTRWVAPSRVGTRVRTRRSSEGVPSRRRRLEM